MYKNFIIFSLLMLSMGIGNSMEVSRGTDKYKNFEVNYDLVFEKSFYQIDGKADRILYKDELQLIFESVKDINKGQLVSFDNFLGEITSKENVTYTAYQRNIMNTIKTGKVSVFQNSSHNIDFPMCMGFNTDNSCKNPLNDITLFDNKIISVECDNCFIGLSGDLYIVMEIQEYHLIRFQFGLKNIYLKGGLGTTVGSHQSWSYAYSKVYHVIDKVKIVSVNVGVTNFDIYADFPVQVDFTSYSAVHDKVNYGIDMDIDIGSLYVEYYKGKWKTAIPKPALNVKPYFHTHTTIDGGAHFSIVPQLKLYSPSIFSMDLKFDPYCDLIATSSVATKNACMNGKYDLNLLLGSSVLNEKLPDKIIYVSGLISLKETCVNFN